MEVLKSCKVLIGEKNGREPSLDIIKKIAAILDVNFDCLLGIKD